MEGIEIKAGTLVVGDGTLVNDARLGIRKGIITEISQDRLNSQYDKQYDFSEKYLMPGIIDAHVHIRYGPVQDIIHPPHEYQAIRALENSRRALHIGATSLGDAGGVGNVCFAVRNAIREGVAYGPRIFTAGEMITMTGGRSRRPGERLEVDGEDSARKAARQLLMYQEADFIKLGATGAISSPHTGPRHPQLTVEEMRAATEEAHKCGKLVHSHCYGEEGISNSLEAGVDVIVHGQTLSNSHIDEMKARGLILLPTLKAFREPIEKNGKDAERLKSTGIWEETEPNYKKALASGITIAMGTDSGMPGNLFGDNLMDLEYMVDWGMKPSQAITAGTLNAAKSLGIDKKLGSIEVGKYADILVLTNNPLENISNIRHLENVILNGNFISRSL